VPDYKMKSINELEKLIKINKKEENFETVSCGYRPDDAYSPGWTQLPGHQPMPSLL
jgi:hypothetical protein